MKTEFVISTIPPSSCLLHCELFLSDRFHLKQRQGSDPNCEESGIQPTWISSVKWV